MGNVKIKMFADISAKVHRRFLPLEAKRSQINFFNMATYELNFSDDCRRHRFSVFGEDEKKSPEIGIGSKKKFDEEKKT